MATWGQEWLTSARQTNVRVGVHKDLEIHEVQQLLAPEHKDTLKEHHVGTIDVLLGLTATQQLEYQCHCQQDVRMVVLLVLFAYRLCVVKS